MDTPFRGPLLSRAIQDYIKKYIIDNGLRAGDALPPEGQLAEDLAVSRGSVREAIKALESLGIVEVRHGNGVFVRNFNLDSVLDILSYGLVFDHSRIADILQIRKWLEMAAVGEVAGSISQAQISELEELLGRWEKKATAGQPTAEEDRAFHRMLYAVLGNDSLVTLLDIFWVVFHAIPVRTITTDLQPTTTLQDHRDIVDALRTGDGRLASQRIQAHFRNIEERIQRAQETAQP